MTQPSAKAAHAIQILLVEDDDGDARAVERTFVKARIANPIVRAIDGVEALDLMKGTNGRARLRRPYLLLVDLNMPRMDGRAVLDELKRDPVLKSIPVIILSTSLSAEDMEHSYEHHANCYVAKPVELEGFLSVVRGVDEFWLASLAALRRGRG